jgi:mRNA interferase MazF
VVGHEQGGTRPVLVVSNDGLNRGPSRLAVVVPLTARERGLPLWVAIEPPEGGPRKRSFAISEALRSISAERLHHRLGAIGAAGLEAVEDRLRVLFEL